MIIRVWTCRVKAEKSRAFLKFIRGEAQTKIQNQPGFISWYVGRLKYGDPHRFVIVTIWRDLASLKKFAGLNWKGARIDPNEAPTLGETPVVNHYDSIL